eukprot:scaffold80_cov382-Prasinococcus_capsulatus_cf.AAC.16
MIAVRGFGPAPRGLPPLRTGRQDAARGGRPRVCRAVGRPAPAGHARPHAVCSAGTDSTATDDGGDDGARGRPSPLRKLRASAKAAAGLSEELFEMRKLDWKAVARASNQQLFTSFREADPGDLKPQVREAFIKGNGGLTTSRQLMRSISGRMHRPEPLGHPMYTLFALATYALQEAIRLQDRLALPIALLTGFSLELRVLSQADHYAGRADVWSIMLAMDCLLVPRLYSAYQRRKPRAVRQRESKAQRGLKEGLVVLGALLLHHYLWMHALWGQRVNALLLLPLVAEVVRRSPRLDTDQKLRLLRGAVPFLSGGGIVAQVVAQGQLWQQVDQEALLVVNVLVQAALVPLLLNKIDLVQMESRENKDQVTPQELKIVAKQLVKKARSTVQKLRAQDDYDELEEEDELVNIDFQTIGSSLPAAAQQLLLFALVKVAITTQMQLVIDG